jgi:hypothetical protein
MTAELKILTPKPKEVVINQLWIGILEDAMVRAKSGECTGGAVIESSEETVRHEWTGLRNKFEFAGLLHRLIAHIMQS